MLGFKNFQSAAIAIAGLELLRRNPKNQFSFSRLRIKGQAAPAIWNVVPGAKNTSTPYRRRADVAAICTRALNRAALPGECYVKPMPAARALGLMFGLLRRVVREGFWTLRDCARAMCTSAAKIGNH